MKNGAVKNTKLSRKLIHTTINEDTDVYTEETG